MPAMSCGTVSQSFVSAIGDPEFKARPFNISPSILLNSKDQKEKAKCREWLIKTKRKSNARLGFIKHKKYYKLNKKLDINRKYILIQTILILNMNL